MKIPQYNIMLDIETLGTSPGCVILEIGAVAFRPSSDLASAPRYSLILRHEQILQQLLVGLKAEYPTVKWWEEQGRVYDVLDIPPYVDPYADSPSLEGHEISKASVELREIFESFNTFFKFAFPELEDSSKIHVWGNGSDFDNTILKAAFEAICLNVPWNAYKGRCFRTMKKLFDTVEEPEFVGVKHCAVDDAMHQAKWLQKIFAEIEKSTAQKQKPTQAQITRMCTTCGHECSDDDAFPDLVCPVCAALQS